MRKYWDNLLLILAFAAIPAVMMATMIVLDLATGRGVFFK